MPLKWSHINWKKEHQKKRKEDQELKNQMRRMKGTTLTSEEARGLIGMYIATTVQHTPEDAKRLGRETESQGGLVWKVEKEGDFWWLIYDWGWGVRLDGVIKWWEETEEC